MSPKFWIACGSLLAAAAVGAGAIGAHALGGRLAPTQLASFETAVRYQLFHALAIVIIGLLAAALPEGAWSAAGWLFFLGVTLFSGGIYAGLSTGHHAFFYATPVGGLCLIAAWLALAATAIRRL